MTDKNKNDLPETQNENAYDHGPPGPPLRLMLLGVGLLIFCAMYFR